MDWRETFKNEISNAEKARSRGNEGQARVCARRAAGLAATEYYARRGQHPGSKSALDTLTMLQGDATVPTEAKAAVASLLMPVNEDFKLPAGVDLIVEARRLRLMILDEA